MLPAASLLTALLLAISTGASPVGIRSTPVSLPFSKRINTSGGTFNPVKQDQAHVAALSEHIAAIQSGKLNARDPASGSIPAVTVSGTSYMVTVGIGSPPTEYNLHFDLSTANVWVGANNKPYVKTSTSEDTGQPVAIPNKAGLFFGEEWVDTLTLSPELVVTRQSIGAAAETYGYVGVDGVIGLGPLGLTVGTLSNQPLVTFPTVTDNLYDQAKIPEDVLSVSFTPPTSDYDMNGHLTFGGTDPSKYIGDISYCPISSIFPTSYFWGIDQVTITYGNTTMMSQYSGIFDTTSTTINFPSDAYALYQQAIGATEDPDTDMLKLTPSQYSNLQNLNFILGTTTYSLPPNGQIWPRVLNSYIGGSSSAIYSVVTSIGYPAVEQRIDFVLGQAFLERFYVVFDTTHQQIGIAATSFTNANTN